MAVGVDIREFREAVERDGHRPIVDAMAADVVFHTPVASEPLEGRAVVEWVPDHTIPFAGSAFRQAIDVELDESAGLILVDAFSAAKMASRGSIVGNVSATRRQAR